VPRLVIVRAEAESIRVANEPLVDARLYLYRAIGVVCLDGLAADVEVESATGEVWAIDCQAGTSGFGRFAT
jgi:hypothetical protein